MLKSSFSIWLENISKLTRMASWWWNPGRLNEKSRILLKSRQGVLLQIYIKRDSIYRYAQVQELLWK